MTSSLATSSAGVDTRGVRLDVPRVKTVRWLEPGYAITVADLDGN